MILFRWSRLACPPQAGWDQLFSNSNNSRFHFYSEVAIMILDVRIDRAYTVANILSSNCVLSGEAGMLHEMILEMLPYCNNPAPN